MRWDYLLSLMQHRGFPTQWTNWIAAILAMSTPKILLNGILLDSMAHGRGLRQGDPLSPLLFVLAIDLLQRLLSLAMEMKLLSKLNGRAARFRASLYVDDVAIFIKPTIRDMTIVTTLLRHFEEATGLQTNLKKLPSHQSTVTILICRRSWRA